MTSARKRSPPSTCRRPARASSAISVSQVLPTALSHTTSDVAPTPPAAAAGLPPVSYCAGCSTRSWGPTVYFSHTCSGEKLRYIMTAQDECEDTWGLLRLRIRLFMEPLQTEWQDQMGLYRYLCSGVATSRWSMLNGSVPRVLSSASIACFHAFVNRIV